MSCPPAELQKKIDELRQKWQACNASPGFDLFVEFAVSLSCFSDFLQARGLSGLNQMSHRLEQQVLALFDVADQQPIAGAVLTDLDHQMRELGERVERFIDSNTHSTEQRREPDSAGMACSVSPTHRVWFVSNNASQWRALMTQLQYFSIAADIYPWQELPTEAEEPAILLLDMQQQTLAQACEQILALRKRFSAGKLIVHTALTAFNQLKEMLRAGGDFCLAQSTPEALILARIIDLCSTEEEPPYRVLVVEDSLTASMSIRRTLKQNGMESLAVTKPAEILDGLRRFEPDLILMDMYMPDCTGVEATRVIRQHAEFLSTPVIYLSGDGDMALQVDALRLGGEHFLTKPFNPVFLNAVVKSKIERYRSLRRSMHNDGLTGLLNHRTVKERLTAAVNAAASTGGLLAVAMIDIDYFKRVNDNYGHPMGDQVLQSMAWLLRRRLRKTDLVGRYGGEEFLVILPGSDSHQAFEVLDRIRRDFSFIKYPFKDSWFETTFSAGLSQYPAVTDPEALIKQADEALYDAKQGGRNCIVTRV
jgi:diguanylate cyclase (GGDEF)-like protein